MMFRKESKNNLSEGLKTAEFPQGNFFSPTTDDFSNFLDGTTVLLWELVEKKKHAFLAVFRCADFLSMTYPTTIPKICQQFFLYGKAIFLTALDSGYQCLKKQLLNLRVAINNVPDISWEICFCDGGFELGIDPFKGIVPYLPNAIGNPIGDNLSFLVEHLRKYIIPDLLCQGGKMSTKSSQNAYQIMLYQKRFKKYHLR